MNPLNQYASLLERLLQDRESAAAFASELTKWKGQSVFNDKDEELQLIVGPSENPRTLRYLVDILKKEHFVYELKSRADSKELNHALRVLSKGKLTGELFDHKDEDEADGMYELLDIADELLKEYNLGIVQFPLDSNSHPITLVPLELKNKIQEEIDELF